MSDSRMIFDRVKCSDCQMVLAKDDALKGNDGSTLPTFWLCEDCYAKRMAEVEGYSK